jgi:hypothetical protein
MNSEKVAPDLIKLAITVAYNLHKYASVFVTQNDLQTSLTLQGKTESTNVKNLTGERNSKLGRIVECMISSWHKYSPF